MRDNEVAPGAVSPGSVETPDGNVPRTPAAREFLIEVACRSASAALLGIFAYGAIRQWLAAPARITLVLLVVTAFVTVGLSLFSKVPARRDWTPMAFLFSVGGTYYFLAVQLTPGTHLIPEWAGATLQVLGLVWQLFAKASLRRAFGILPANRGVVSGGAYRFMRHPMYLGYFLTDIGFLLVNFDVRNVIVYGAQFALQAGRIWREERLLSDDERYRAYRQRVRYRVLPGLF
ncbi:isoprenylcysteine carboxyl methyltransferase [Pandoraea thiooxydans]|uniref:methyltransferase family protein n=1 Tax=Pandoraea thiooxydans TaxID=445709 RepID=UPI00094A9716|nr:isoprenylcysteine carboxylmethyltransferase family protein [Pandoraea thiooxydans]APR96025.1 isoprenylcysteine carboxyl methyltransferase [Pandoraea thiooxydans]